MGWGKWLDSKNTEEGEWCDPVSEGKRGGAARLGQVPSEASQPPVGRESEEQLQGEAGDNKKGVWTLPLAPGLLLPGSQRGADPREPTARSLLDDQSCSPLGNTDAGHPEGSLGDINSKLSPHREVPLPRQAGTAGAETPRDYSPVSVTGRKEHLTFPPPSPCSRSQGGPCAWSDLEIGSPCRPTHPQPQVPGSSEAATLPLSIRPALLPSSSRKPEPALMRQPPRPCPQPCQGQKCLETSTANTAP